MLQDSTIRLRNLTSADIAHRIRWETIETEWQLWDAPWENEGLSAEEKQSELEAYVDSLHRQVERLQSRPADALRYSFQIDTLSSPPSYIGWVSSYCIDDEYTYTEADTPRLAVGIDIPALSARGKGYAYHALCLFIDYLLAHGYSTLYTQTWSGNARMIHIAGKLGFEECCRKRNIRTVRGEKYDGLTFRLNREKYAAFRSTIR